MSMNHTLFETIREEMIEGLLNKKGVINIERYLLDYIDKLDAVKLVKKYHCSLDEAIDAIEAIQHSDEVRKIITQVG